jgi:hypothetical protein
MATLAIYTSAAFTTASGVAVAANATVEVRRESDSGLAAIYANRDGTGPITNPSAFADGSGRFSFYAAGISGGYSITVTKGAESYTVRNQAIGTAGELDATSYIGGLFAAATAAIARGVLGLTTIAAKGDLWVGSALDTLATLTVGANGTIPMARSADAKGIAYVAALTKAIHGFTFAPAAGSPTDTNAIDIAAGGAMDSTGAYWIAGAASTKKLNTAWAVGSGNGGLDTGAVGNSDYYLWAIVRSDTGVVDYLFSLSSTAPTMPANYDFKRLIGWVKRVGGVIVPFKTYETEGGGIEMNWDSPTLDVSLANTLSTARREDAVKVPLNFSVIAHLNVRIIDAATAVVWIYCPDQSDLAPSTTAAPLANIYNVVAGAQNLGALRVRTSATGTIAARSDVATVDSYLVSTMGFTWARRN